jgi:hypothetical protein
MVELTAKERQGRGLDALAVALRPYVEEHMAAAITGDNWVALYEAKETHRRGRPYRADLSDPRLLLQMVRYERTAFPDVDASQRAWLEELIQAGNRAAHTTEVSRRQADRALDTMTLLAESLGLDSCLQPLTELRLDSASHLDGAESEARDAPRPVDAVDESEDRRAKTTDSSTEPESDAGPDRGPIRAKTFPTEESSGTRNLTAIVDDARIVVRYQEAVNLALVHNGVSPIRSLQISNSSDHNVQLDSLVISINDPTADDHAVLGVPLTIEQVSLQPGEEFVADGPELSMRLNPNAFLAVDEATTTQIRMAVESCEQTYVTDDGIRVLTAEEWWAAGIPESLAAFVRPNDPAITAVLQEAAELLRDRTGSSSLQGYQAGVSRVQAIAEAIYQALAARKITYIEPPASFEGASQRIRSHTAVLEDHLGTCLDLACLYAAALEQAGIHPIVAVFDGHAFTGYLTEDDQLPAVVVADLPTAQTVVDCDFFDSIELTAVCYDGVGFDHARQATARWLTRDLGKLRYLLDVDAAHRHLKPLPTIRQQGDTKVIEVVREQAWEPTRRAPAQLERRDRVAAADADTPPRVHQWQRALLDMSYANPLLRRKRASTVGIHVPQGSLGSLEDRIAAGEAIRLVPGDDIPDIHRAQGARTASEIDHGTLRAILEQERKLFVDADEDDYQRRLKSLARRSKTAVEETGSDNLYLTLGTLAWTDGARRGAAPLFLVPIRLTGGAGRGRAVTPFTIEIDDNRERVPNYCLIEKLRDYDLDIPELEIPEMDDSGIDVVGALAAVRTAILRQTMNNSIGFHVDEDAHLALLQFSTMEMWRDLRSNWRSFVKRPAIGHLVENYDELFHDGVEAPEADAQDEARTFLPIPADGSQIGAVRWAAAGKTFILEGPPGTGKSQTITNLIAHALAEGQRVLFVAEKAAALDVVRRRLDQIGIGEFTLDVHGRTQSVSAVRDQLKRALEEEAVSEPGWDSLRSAYATATLGLEHYPRQLHQPGPAGLSAWDAHQLILEQESPGLDIDGAIVVPRSAVTGNVELAELYRQVESLREAIYGVGGSPQESAWRLAHGTDPDQLDGERLEAAVDAVSRAHEAIRPVGDLATLMDLMAATDDVSALSAWLRTVQAGNGYSTKDAARLVDRRWLTEAQLRREAVARFRADQDRNLGVFTPLVLHMDLEHLVARSEEIDRKLFGKKKLRAAMLAELAGVLRAPLPDAGLTDALRRARAVQAETPKLRGYVAQLPGVRIGPDWDPFDERNVARFEQATQSIETADQLRQFCGQLFGRDAASLAGLDETTERLTHNSRPAADLAALVEGYAGAWSQLGELLGASPISIDGWLAGRSRTTALADHLPQWRADAAGGAFIALQRWARLWQSLRPFADAGVDDLVQRTLAGEIDPLDVDAQFRIGVATSVLDERLHTTGLASFDQANYRRRVEDFQRRASEVRRRMPNELRARILGHRTFDPQARVGEVHQLKSELGRRKGGRSVRRLLHDYADLIGQLTPCLLMSPHSVARFLPADSDFDLVIFDEASQIRVAESVGALGRAKAAVIVGDSKQMPPTAMFTTGSDDSDRGDELVPADLESILSEAVESQFPRRLLTWHYRSSDETLIAFSNSRYYDGSLSSFPAPPAADRTNAVELRHVDGTWEGGRSGAARVNRAEAEAIVEEVRRLVHAGPDSIGVVTFNSQQRDLILDLLEGDDDPLVYENLHRESEPVFVKNLENVQGDERDIVLFSLAFSADENGRIPLNWGPLTRAGGERRLNVAITRAKKHVVIFSSFDPRRLDLSNSSSAGLNDLKDYLLQASGRTVVASTRRRGLTDKHLEDVAAALEDAGLDVRQSIGLSEFVVDLAVREPGAPCWVAVLLDGPAWAGRSSVGDRELLPHEVLVRMGWADICRVWLPSWLRDREGSVALIVESARSAAKQADSDAATSVLVPRETAALPDGPAISAVPMNGAQVGEQAADPITTTSDLRPDRTAEDSDLDEDRAAEPQRVVDLVDGASETISRQRTRNKIRFKSASRASVHESSLLDDNSTRSRDLIRREIELIIAAEAPILRDRLVEVLAARFDLSRVRESRRRQLEGLLGSYPVRRAANGDAVVWSRDEDPNTYAKFRLPADGAKREIRHVPYEELRNAMIHVAKGSHGADEESLLREVSRMFGAARTASVIKARLERALDAAVQEGRLVREGNIVRFPEE